MCLSVSVYTLVFLYYYFVFFFNDTATTEIYTLSLHDALPISGAVPRARRRSGHYLLRRRHQHRRQVRLHRSEEHTSELQSHVNLVCRLLLEKKKIGYACYTSIITPANSGPAD